MFPLMRDLRYVFLAPFAEEDGPPSAPTSPPAVCVMPSLILTPLSSFSIYAFRSFFAILFSTFFSLSSLFFDSSRLLSVRSSYFIYYYIDQTVAAHIAAHSTPAIIIVLGSPTSSVFAQTPLQDRITGRPSLHKCHGLGTDPLAPPTPDCCSAFFIS